jgi:Ca2+:H+ antiporter
MVGVGFFFGTINRVVQFYNPSIAHTFSGLFFFGAASIIIPTVATPASSVPSSSISRGIDCILIVVYAAHIIFYHKTHENLMVKPSLKVPMYVQGGITKGRPKQAMALIRRLVPAAMIREPEFVDVESGQIEDEEPCLSFGTTVIGLAIFLVLLGFQIDFVTSSITGVLISKSVSATFIGMIIFPILTIDPGGITYALKDNQDVNVEMNISRSIQLHFFVTPFIVLLGWVLGKEMSLDFPSFVVASFSVSVGCSSAIYRIGECTW